MPRKSTRTNNNTNGSRNAQQFWDWFENNEHRYKNIRDDPDKSEEFINELVEQIKPFNPWLKALIGLYDDERNELIITADGDVAMYCKVHELLDYAPSNPGWIFTAFKREMGFDNISINMFDKEFGSDTVNFYATVDDQYPDEVCITLTHKGYSETEDEEFQTAGMILLENALGEINTSTKIDLYRVGPEPEGSELIPIIKLPDYLNWREKEFIEKYEHLTNERPAEDWRILEGETESGKPLFAAVDNAFSGWDFRPAYPWVIILEINYQGNQHGLPDEQQSETMGQIEDAIWNLVSKDDNILLGHKTFDNQRTIYFYSKEYLEPSRLIHEYLENTDFNFEIKLIVLKDKYWRSVEQLLA